MKILLMGAMLATMVLPMSPAAAEPERSWSDRQRDEDTRANQRRDNHRDNRGEGVKHRRQHHDNGRHLGWQKRPTWQQYNRYDYNRFEPRFGNYQANQYYRDGRYYPDYRLTNADRIYRGSNGQYYCRRNDGTTGLIIGAIGDGILGRVIAPNGSKTLGTILGDAGGALIGRSIGRNGVRCN